MKRPTAGAQAVAAARRRPTIGIQLLLALVVGLSVSGCVSARITPTTVAAVHGREAERAAALQRWDEAVSLCNGFLASSARQTLPAGRVEFDGAGMTFVTDTARLPMRVRCTTFGDWLIPFRMAAQERSDGFVVGRVPPRQSRILDNSFFKYSCGETQSSVSMAGTILHELTHSYYKLGTVGFFQGVSYYAEAILLLRYRTHSKEMLPFRTSAEFRRFAATLPRKPPA